MQPEHRSPKHTVRREPELNEVVLVTEENQLRGLCKVAKVVELRRWADNAVRSVVIELPNGNKQHRAINHLYPLEISAEKENPIDKPAHVVLSKIEQSKNQLRNEPAINN